MKKTNIILFAFLFSFLFTNAQKELWGVSQQTLSIDQQGNNDKFNHYDNNSTKI